jgi:hypothetical protein
MKKYCLFSVFLVMFSIGLYAEPSFAIGVGAEVDGYSQSGMGLGIGGAMDYRFNEMFSFGARGLYTLDLGGGGISVAEVTGNVRWYFLRFRNLLNYYYILQSRFHFFAQADIGGAFVYTGETGSKTESALSFGAVAGVRIVFGSFYTEPYIRFSSTGLYGGGAMLGWIFSPYGK